MITREILETMMAATAEFDTATHEDLQEIARLAIRGLPLASRGEVMRTIDEIKSCLALKRSFLAESQEHSDIVRLEREIKKLDTELWERLIIEDAEPDNMRLAVELAKDQIARLEEENKMLRKKAAIVDEIKFMIAGVK